MKVAFITGVTGQDGSYLSEFLLDKGYKVVGLTRICSESKHERIEHLKSNPLFHMVDGDLSDTARIDTIIKSLIEYDTIEVYNLGAQSHVHLSFANPEYTANVDALGTLRILEAIHKTGHSEKYKFYQAGTSEMFGKVTQPIQNEETPFHPRSPYGVSKVFGYWITKNYRESYDMFACTGILFNHESERRGENFVTRKITLGLNEYLNHGTPIEIGNTEARRDWGYAKDYVEAMWLMLQRDTPDDYVISTGKTHSIKDFIETCLDELGISYRWREDGSCIQTDLEDTHKFGDDAEEGIPRVICRINSDFFRPAEVDVLIGDASKAKRELGWEPKTDFNALVKLMLKNDVTKYT